MRAHKKVIMSNTTPPYPKSHDLLLGKNVLVTAAAGTGIGFAAAKRCAEEGARVVISDIHERRLAAAALEIEKTTEQKVLTQLCDVSDDLQVRSLIDAALSEMGSIDVLINNAGLGGYAKVASMTDEEWQKVLDITLSGTFRVTRAVLPHMQERRKGIIINNASVLGWRAQEGQAHYAAAKAGVMAFTRCVAMEAAEYGIRINAVSPSLAMHPFLEKVTPKGLLEELTQREAFGRAAETWEIANVMVFLASDYSSYMTGEVVAVSSQHP